MLLQTNRVGALKAHFALLLFLAKGGQGRSQPGFREAKPPGFSYIILIK